MLLRAPCLLLLWVALLAHTGQAGSNSGTIRAQSGMTVANSVAGCGVATDALRVSKSANGDGKAHSVLLRFDITPMFQTRLVPDLVVLRLPAKTISGQSLVGRLTATVVKNEWDATTTSCTHMPAVIQKYEFPEKAISGIAGEELTLNLEGTVRQMVEDGVLALSVLISAHNTEQTNLEFMPVGNNGPALDYHLEATSDAQAELLSGQKQVVAGGTYVARFLIPKVVVGSSGVLAGDNLPDNSIVVHVNEGNANGNTIENTVAIEEDDSDSSSYFSYTATFRPTVAGAVRIEVLLLGTPLKNSPQSIQVNAAAVDPSKTTSDATTADYASGARVGEEQCFEIRGRDQFNNLADTGRLQVDIKTKTEEKTVSVTRTLVSPGVEKICFVPSTVDDVTLDVKSEDQSCAGFPVAFSVTPGIAVANKTRLKIAVEDVSFDNVVAGDTIPTIISTFDQSGHQTHCDISKATIKTSGPGQVTTKASWISDSPFGSQGWMNITATVSGKYNVTLIFDNTEAQLFSMTVVAAEANGNTCALGKRPQGATAGAVYSFDIVTKDSFGNSVPESSLQLELIVSAEPRPQDEPQPQVTSELVDHGNGTYSASWSADLVGKYSVTVREKQRAAQVVRGCPFDVEVAPSSMSTEHSRITTDLSKPIPAGDAPKILFQERDEFANIRTVADKNFTLTIKLTFEGQTESIELELQSLGDGRHTVDPSDYLRRVGTYTLQMRANTTVVQELTLTVVPGPPSPVTSLVVTTQTTPVKVGEFASIMLRLRDRFGNDVTLGGMGSWLRVEAIGGAKTDVCVITDNNNGQYEAKFRPTATGPYTIFILLLNIQFADSPLQMDSIPGDTFGPSSLAIGGGLRSAIAGVSQSILIQAADIEGNLLRTGGSVCKGSALRFADEFSSSTDKLDLACVDNDDGTYSLNYNITQAGTFTLLLNLAGADVQGSPFLLIVHPNEISPRSVLDTAPLEEITPIAGVPFVLVFTAYDAFDNRRVVGGDDVSVTFTLVDEAGAAVPGAKVYFGSMLDNLNGTYNVTGYFTKSGRYHIAVASNGKAYQRFTESEYFTVLPGPSSVEHATVEGEALHTAFAGQEGVAVLKMRDRFYNEVIAGGDNVTAVIAQLAPVGGMPTAAHIPTKIDDLGNGTYLVSYNILISGQYTFGVMLGVDDVYKDVVNSPTVLTISPANATATHSYLSKDTNSTVAGSTIHYLLHTHDEFNNTCDRGGAVVEVTCSPSQGNAFSVEVVDTKNGLYTIRATPKRAGRCRLQVKVNGSPLRSNQTLSVSPSQTIAVRSHIEVSDIADVEAGKSVVFPIITVDSYGNPTPATDGDMQVRVTGPGASDSVGGKFVAGEGTFVPLRAGQVTLVVEFNGVGLLNSPHRFTVHGSVVNALHTKANGTALTVGMAGSESSFDVIARDRFGNKATRGSLEVRVLDHEGSSISVDTIFDESAGVYHFKFVPTLTGIVTISVSTTDTDTDATNAQIVDSPFVALVQPGPTDAERSLVVGNGIGEANVGKLNKFVIVARDSLGNLRHVGGDTVRVMVTNEQDVRRLTDFTIEDSRDGLYHVSYVAPAVEGDIIIEVLLNGKPVGGKNYTVGVLQEVEIRACPDECTHHGVCNNRTWLCTCNEGWIGPACDVPHISCNSNCNGNGLCNFRTGACVCYAGFNGSLCECPGSSCKVEAPAPAEPQGPLCKNNCSNHGVCIARNSCNCDVGFAGEACEVRTLYELVPLESGFALLYEVETGRLFGAQIILSDDRSCAGFNPLGDTPTSFLSSTFVRRQPHMSLTHLGENKVLELNRATGVASLLSFRTTDLSAQRLGIPSSRVLGAMSALAERELTYLGNNRLMLTKGEESSVWIINRQDPELLVDEVASHTWAATGLGNAKSLYAGDDVVARYTKAGQYNLYSYNRADDSFSDEAFESGWVPFLTEFETTNRTVVRAFPADTWVVFSPETTNFRSFSCKTDPSLGFTGCTFLNVGNVLRGFSCPTTPPNVECKSLTSLDCLKSDRCGFCTGTESCLLGSKNGPTQTTCPGKWVFGVEQFGHNFGYIGSNYVLDHEPETGRYNVWLLERTPRSEHCPTLSETVATGFLDESTSSQLVFADHSLISFNPHTAAFSVGECDLEAITAENTLKCEAWAAGFWPELRFRTLAVLSNFPVLLLDYDQRNGDYRVWQLASRGDYEAGQSLLPSLPRNEGSLPQLRDAQVTALDEDMIIAHQPIVSSTAFLRISGNFQLDVRSETAPKHLEFVTVGSVDSVKQFAFTALGPRSLLMFGPRGYWKALQCQRYPYSGDVFGNEAPISCFATSSGAPDTSVCSARTSEDGCLAQPQCGWCKTTSTCHVGFVDGICSTLVANCPKEEWALSLVSPQFDSTFVGEVTSNSETDVEHDCAAPSCMSCVADAKCGWHTATKTCVAGTPAGPHNSDLVTPDISSKWNFFYCEGVDACAAKATCADCTKASYCGWCESTSKCVTGTSTRPLFDVCPTLDVENPYHYAKCPARSNS